MTVQLTHRLDGAGMGAYLGILDTIDKSQGVVLSAWPIPSQRNQMRAGLSLPLATELVNKIKSKNGKKKSVPVGECKASSQQFWAI